jgi:CheY-like chemotaxis protein
MTSKHWHPNGPSRLDEASFLEPLPAPHIVVLEPDIEILDLIGNRLHREGLSVTMVNGPLDMATLRRIEPDIIILGLTNARLAETHGLIERIRCDDVLQRTSAICCAVVPGDDEYLTLHRVFPLPYPFEPDDLMASILGELSTRESPRG